ncbi:MAG: hypothetical protein IPJ41_05560 [Phycisphaerales bacterium]|nr:hypothetical protein [Phycisphaerales bacterium]
MRGVAVCALILCGALFVWSALAKVEAGDRFRMVLEAHAVVPTALVAPLAAGVIAAEFGSGLLLLCSAWTRVQGLALALTAGVLTALTLYLLMVLWRGNPHTDCGCFGPFAGMKVLHAILRNVVLLALVCTTSWVLQSPATDRS